ncbi:efflux transporter outer membrane subunit [Ramlibacter tataouinensis]|uniref:RND transporter n=1 Tax=Ramlibacter tataouinensis TaxID=94132 RepID=A0A127JPK9_9BURK|nr:efflux transporter outer membrane subunit [Ramlibacter tataouinensis]AMO21931.1 RND transporter [Ramlibacter tataouinensis]
MKRARPGVLVAALALAGCADMAGIAPQSTLRTAESVGLAPGAAAPAFVPAAEWWRDFGDPQLDQLIAQALEGNPNLKIAQARLARAQAATEGARAATLPQVGGAIDLQRQRFTEHGLFPPPLAGSIVDTGTLQIEASWELDFFGKNRAALDATLRAADAAQADAQAARVLLAANVARAWFHLARVEDQLKVAQRTLAQRDETLRLVQDRVRAGLDSQLELRQSESALPEARQQIEALREQSEIARHAIAALTGQGNRPVQATPSLSGAKAIALPAELPADLLGRRPDIAAARLRVEASGHELQNAKAQFYPNVNLVAFAGLSSLGLGPLLDPGSRQWGVGPAIRLPLFEGGRLRANLRGVAADRDAAVESYNGAVLDAIRDTADQVASLQSITRQQAQQREAQAGAEAAYQIALQRYQAGLGTYLNVLSAETAVLNQRRLGVDLAARALDTQVALIRALGGGWQGERAAPAVATK